MSNIKYNSEFVIIDVAPACTKAALCFLFKSWNFSYFTQKPQQKSLVLISEQPKFTNFLISVKTMYGCYRIYSYNGRGTGIALINLFYLGTNRFVT